MQISIANAIGGTRGLSFSALLGEEYKTRVLADGGTVENLSCANSFIDSLSPYNGNLPLGLYTGAAAAYSLRLLNPDYTGSAIRVRRSSDDTEQDIGFSGNGLDTSALETFCGVGDGFVVTWYDQSGNGNDATNATEAEQPKIVSSGSTITENGKPAIDYSGNTKNLVSVYTGSANVSLFMAAYFTMSTTQRYIFLSNIRYDSPTDNAGFGLDVRGDSANDPFRFIFFDDGLNTIEENNPTSGQYIKSFIIGGGTANVYTDGSLDGTGSYTIGSDPTNLIMGATNFSPEMKAQEILIWNTDQSSNRTSIESNINSEYGIY